MCYLHSVEANGIITNAIDAVLRYKCSICIMGYIYVIK